VHEGGFQRLHPLRCPACGKDDSPGRWEQLWRAPFRAIEKVTTSWDFDLEQREDSPVLVIQTRSETIDTKSGEGVEIECKGCFHVFAVPEHLQISFE
jgi:hypothetical protein